MTVPRWIMGDLFLLRHYLFFFLISYHFKNVKYYPVGIQLEIDTCLKDNGADLPNSEVAGGF